jgi:[NiFe] hydrogenase diaphorase moiety large subunit
MSTLLETAVKRICKDLGNDPTRLLDVARAVQEKYRCVSDEAMDVIARKLEIPRVTVESLVSFYAFLSREPKGRVVIRLCDDVIDRMHGYARVRDAFCEELGIELGQTTPDGNITLERTACIGMSDQAPAALVNDVVVTRLNSDRAKEIVRELREHMDPARLVRTYGRGNNSHPLVRSMVRNHIQTDGLVLLSPVNRGEALRKALSLSPREVIREVKTARLRGRGGAGFPCGMKWEFTRAAERDDKIVICNADEGEPGTFKDRVLLTEFPDRVFAGMTIAGYAIGADDGILYLRAEYAYLKPFLEDVLERRRREGLLGVDVFGMGKGDFDIRIQMGAGAYVCGEETALISSCEGTRGDPKNRPPFPAQHGYLGRPTSVNNVETLCCVTKILEEGAAAFNQYGTQQSSGTKLLSISGDCRRPGVFEVPFGTTLTEVLEMCDGEDAIAVQVGGPSGRMVGPDRFAGQICFDDLATGGSIMVFGQGRNLLAIVHAFLEFFEEESCGYCTPCRVGNVLLRKGLERVMAGRAGPEDVEQFQDLGRTMKAMSRCGLGQTSPNPVLSTMESFPDLYRSRVVEDPDGYRRSFDFERAVALAEGLSGRTSVHAHEPAQAQPHAAATE